MHPLHRTPATLPCFALLALLGFGATFASAQVHPIHLDPPPDDTTTAPATPAKPATKATTKRSAQPAATPAPAPTPAAVVQPVAPATSPTLAPATVPATTSTPPAAMPAAAGAPTTPPPSAPADTATAAAPPPIFGFYAGETKSQIIAAIGAAAILKQDGDILEVNAAPAPDPNFDSYLLVVGPTDGLVKLIATGKDLDEDPDGSKIKAQFTALKTSLSQTYGDPGDVFDFINSKSTLKKPSQFMISLTKNERSLSAYWTKKDFGNKIASFSLEGNGLGDDTGYLSLEFEFTGYHNYLLHKTR